jgi:hypothetical protein
MITATATVPTQHRFDRAETVTFTAVRASHAEAAQLASLVPAASLYAAAAAPCPPWCGHDIVGSAETLDEGVRFHVGSDQVVTISDVDDTQTSQVHVALERFDTAGEPLKAVGVRLEGDGPMTAAQALQLADALIAAARTALR